MYVSRSESHQHNKKRKARRMKRLLVINLIMIGIIGGLVIVYFTLGSKNGAKNAADGITQQQTTDKPSVTDDHPSSEQHSDDGGDAPANGSNSSHQPSDNGGGGTAPGTGADAGADNGAVNGKGTDTGSGSNNGAVNGPDAGTNVNSGTNGGTAGGTNANSGSGSGSDPDNSGDAAGGLENDNKVTLSFVGDILLAGSVDALMKKNGYEYPYLKALPFLTAPDLTAANLETPITERGVPAPNKSFVFKGSPKSLPAFKQAGFDIVNLANNHTLDQGVEGLFDTINHLGGAKIPNMGAGRNDSEAFKPMILDAKGVRVAYLGLTRVVPVGSWKAEKNRPGLAETYDARRALKAIREAKKQADIVVVMVHWGIERADKPNAVQKELAHAYIDAGADLIIGSHPHVLQGFEQYKGKWISYSLGNFIFNMTATDRTKDTGVLDAVCSQKGDCSLRFHPMRAVNSQPIPLVGDKAAALLKRISGLSFKASLDQDGYINAKG
ncbi:CapA family protein [Paenibacillus solisilvae]|uniref:CapA family protein n=1 Tax=Paenibacillus solisilvae TaxID=2486751 RepID=A0ABW0W0U5_9BACL